MELVVGITVMVAIFVVVVEDELPPQPETSTSASAVIASRKIGEKIFRLDTTRRALNAARHKHSLPVAMYADIRLYRRRVDRWPASTLINR